MAFDAIIGFISPCLKKIKACSEIYMYVISKIAYFKLWYLYIHGLSVKENLSAEFFSESIQAWQKAKKSW